MLARRFYSIKPHESIFVISLPITTRHSYIYCNHKPAVLKKAHASKFPLITKLENRATGLVLKGWTKLSTSKNSVNVKVTNFVKGMLDTIPYQENCLRSFPSKNSMIRQINDSSSLVQSEINQLNIPKHQVKPIPFYHAKFQSTSNILDQLESFKEDNRGKHRKYAFLCGIGIPISLPFALVPVLPNIPGFYLTYRLYCNIKALLGIKHLEYLLEDNNLHLDFVTKSVIDDIYSKYNSTTDLLIDSVQEEERLVITEDIIDAITSTLDLPQLNEELRKALRQEKIRLNKNIKINDAVE